MARYDDAKTALDKAILDELATLRTNGTLGQYLQDNQSAILTDLMMTKDNNMVKVHGDMARALDGQKNTFYYYQRNKDMLELGDIPLKRLQKDAENAMYDHHNAKRQYEINQWTSGNRMDTLFGYQVIFLAVTLLAIFTGLWRLGFITTGLLSFLTFALITVVVLTFVIRVQYSVYRRNKRYWNKRDFPGHSGSIDMNLDCPTLEENMRKLSPENLRGLANNISSEVQGTVQRGLSGAAYGFSQAAAEVGSANFRI
jgi:hypothetical protein